MGDHRYLLEIAGTYKLLPDPMANYILLSGITLLQDGWSIKPPIWITISPKDGP